MKILDLVQGSDEWHQVRLEHCTASEAPLAMGDTDQGKRTELLDLKKTGEAKAVSGFVQKFVFDPGHAMEASAREHLEVEMGEDLYPVVASVITDGIPLLASVDGQTMDGSILFEHKGWNEELAAMVRSGELPPKYYWQLEQQLHIFGAEKVLFVVSDGTLEKREILEYTPVPGRFNKLLAGWAQFLDDLDSHVVAAPDVKLVARNIANLPDLVIKLSGAVTASNLDQYKAQALEFIGSIKTDLQEDQDFVDAEATVKFCDAAEKRIAEIKKKALDDTASIKEAFEALDQMAAAMREKRLALNKLVTSRKAEIKDEIRTAAENDWLTHLAALDKEVGPRVRLPAIKCDIAGAMLNKRNLSSLRDAAQTAVAKAKIEANEIAAVMRTNLAVLRELPKNRHALFTDAQDIILKAADDFANLVALRVKAAEDQEAEDLRLQKIRDEEIAEQAREQERQRRADEEAARQQEEAQTRQQQEYDASLKANSQRVNDLTASQAAAPAGNTAPVETPATRGPGDVGTRTVTSQTNDVKTTAGASERAAVAELVSLEALLVAILDGRVSEDLVQVNQQAVTDYMAAMNGVVPPGFRLVSQ